MNETLDVFLKVYLGVLLVNVVIAVFHYRESGGHPVQRTQLYFWATFLGIFLVAGLLSDELSYLTVMGYSLSFIQSHILARFANLTLGVKYRLKPYLLVFAVAEVLAFTLWQLGFPFQVYCAPVALGIAAPAFYVLYSAIRERRWSQLSFNGKAYIICFLLYAFHELDFPILRPYPGATIFGATAMLMIIIVFSTLLATLSIESMRKGYEEKLQTEVNQKTEMLLASSKMAALGEMAGGIAHEINNPLMIISGAAQTLTSRFNLEKPVVDKLDVIVQTTDRIAKIITGLRTFSREGKNDPFVTVPVRLIVEDTLSLCSANFQRQGVKLKVDLGDEPLLIRCQTVQLSQVLLNLLNNANDAIANHSDKWISVSAALHMGRIHLSVTDSGTGIPKEIRDKIFQPFFTTKPIGVGTGLGLSVSAGIVQSHGGSLYVDVTSPNTRFVIDLPRA